MCGVSNLLRDSSQSISRRMDRRDCGYSYSDVVDGPDASREAPAIHALSVRIIGCHRHLVHCTPRRMSDVYRDFITRGFGSKDSANRQWRQNGRAFDALAEFSGDLTRLPYLRRGARLLARDFPEVS